jgi:hypothetical protein
MTIDLEINEWLYRWIDYAQPSEDHPEVLGYWIARPRNPRSPTLRFPYSCTNGACGRIERGELFRIDLCGNREQLTVRF